MALLRYCCEISLLGWAGLVRNYKFIPQEKRARLTQVISDQLGEAIKEGPLSAQLTVTNKLHTTILESQ